MAILLNIDASGSHLYISVSNNGIMVAEAQSEVQKNHAADLQPMVASVLQKGNITMQQIQGVAVINGPGSYTGLRVALAAAKGYCFGLDIPLFCISNLACLAHGYFLENPEKTEVLAIISPMKEELFVESYSQPVYNKKNLTILTKANSLIEIEKHLLATKASCGAVSDDILEQFSIKNYSKITFDSKWINQLGFAFYQNNWAVNLVNAEPFYIKAIYINQKAG